MDAARLVGGWELLDWSTTVDGEHAGYPMGAEAVGRLLYTADGHMSALLHAADRPAFGTRLFGGATAAERDAAALTFMAYGGTYTVLGDEVHHHVAHSLFPDWAGTVLVRSITWDGDELVLTTPAERTSSGKTVVNHVRWRRAST